MKLTRLDEATRTFKQKTQFPSILSRSWKFTRTKWHEKHFWTPEETKLCRLVYTDHFLLCGAANECCDTSLCSRECANWIEFDRKTNEQCTRAKGEWNWNLKCLHDKHIIFKASSIDFETLLLGRSERRSMTLQPNNWHEKNCGKISFDVQTRGKSRKNVEQENPISYVTRWHQITSLFKSVSWYWWTKTVRWRQFMVRVVAFRFLFIAFEHVFTHH